MLHLIIPQRMVYNEDNGVFTELPEQKLDLEHSLISISKWEAIWEKPFLKNYGVMTNLEQLSYIKQMTIRPSVNSLGDQFFLTLPRKSIHTIQEYINNPMTATTFQTLSNARKNSEIITSEIIYYWMVEHGIPFECEKWHLNRLLTLIRVCNIKRNPSKKKVPINTILARNAALNKKRREALNSPG